MIKDYLLIGSTLELNIRKSEKDEISKKFKRFEKSDDDDIPNDFFDKILNLITDMLTLEEYSKFLTSSHFQEYYFKNGFEIFIMKQEEKWNITNDDHLQFFDEIDFVDSDNEIEKEEKEDEKYENIEVEIFE